ncbi:hypothetical protein M3215_05580 [Bacillus cytotoxicus]|uniref:Uncharacterized protein n=1 Tax=Bacillus cytotoxicus TaxID=580165 RepID=A0ACC6A3Z0_9BACI|nr:hypothetical protein [Bacillus cytotoxicus]
MSVKNDACLTNEAVLIQSVVCSKKIRLIAHSNACVRRIKNKNIQFVPDLMSIKLTGTLLKDLIVIQGSIKGSIVIDGKCLQKITLLFQDETVCEDVCPGDILKHTDPILEGVLPPQVILEEEHHDNCVVFKVILSIQATVVREKLATISVSIIGDINENRCQPQFTPTSIITCEVPRKSCEVPREPCECHHCNDDDDDSPYIYEDSDNETE